MQNPQYSQNPEHPEVSGTQPQDSRVQTPQNPPEPRTETPQNPPDPRMERAQFLNSRNHYAVHNHIFVSGIGEDWCEGYLDVEEDVTNVYGMPHGGTYFSLADVLAGMVLRANGYNFVTQSASCHYMRSTKEKRMYARAEIMKRGRNANITHRPRNQTQADYRRATGFEALMGYLYLTGRIDRCIELLTIAIKSNEK